MRQKVRIGLSICLLTALSAGFFQLLSSSLVEAGIGVKIKTIKDLSGDFKCAWGSIKVPGKLSFSADLTGGIINLQILSPPPGFEVNNPGTIRGLKVSGSGGGGVEFSFSGRIQGLCAPGSNPIDVFGHFSGSCIDPGSGSLTLLNYNYFGPEAPTDLMIFKINEKNIECEGGGGVQGSFHPCFSGTENNDNLVGTAQNDCLDGKGGNDKIAGLDGNDKLNGGDGNDLLSGGNGNDELTGGKGADRFDCGAGKDKITDFKPSEGDIKSTNCEQF